MNKSSNEVFACYTFFYNSLHEKYAKVTKTNDV